MRYPAAASTLMPQYAPPSVLGIVIVLAVGAWGVAAFSWLKTFKSLPKGRWTIPLFSRDPRYISAEGIVWRRRFLIACGCFALVVLGAGILGAIFFPNG
jgi:hypothetical protein